MEHFIYIVSKISQIILKNFSNHLTNLNNKKIIQFDIIKHVSINMYKI